MIEVGGLTIVNDCLQRQPGLVPGRDRDRAGHAQGTPAGVRRRDDAGAGAARRRRHHAAMAAALVGLEPDLLAAVGRVRAGAGALCGTAQGPAAYARPTAVRWAPLLKARLTGDELVVLKASRGVALERILPYLTGQDHPTH